MTEGKPPGTRGELAVVVILLAAGVVLRWGRPDAMAVEHFDEGVYASNVWFGAESGGGYPQRQFYAPPLLPGAVEVALVLQRAATMGNRSPLWVMAPSLLAGCATLLLLYAVARDWLGREVAVGALAVAALSDFHAMYSRAALTESLLLMWMVAALGLLGLALRRESMNAAAGAGVCVGLAWWTKYNGWLPLAMSLGAIVWLAAWGRPAGAHRARTSRRLALWLVTAAIALLTWTPYLSQLQSTGGYQAVAANHRRYVVGLGGWWDSLLRQAGSLRHYDGWLSAAAVAIASLAAVWPLAAKPKEPARADDQWTATWPSATRVATWVLLPGLTAAASLVVGATLVLAALAAVCLVARLRGWARGEPTTVGGVLLLSWAGGLLLLTPLYHPYPRIALPWVAGLWLAAADGLRITALGSARLTARHAWVWAVVPACLLLAAAWHAGPPQRPVAWQDRRGLRRVAAEMDRQLRGQPAAVLVYGEPALFYHLRALDGPAAAAAGDLSFADAAQATAGEATLYLAEGPHARRTPSYVEQLGARRDRFELVAEFHYAPSDLVRLNQLPAAEVRRQRGAKETLRLYRLKKFPTQ